MLIPTGIEKVWQQWSARYQALSQRERGLVAAAFIASIAYLGGVLWVQPMFARAKSYARQAEAQEAELNVLQSQIMVLGQQVAGDPDEPLRLELARVEQQLAATEVRLAVFNGSLVPPERTGALLDGLVRKNGGVRLAGFQTLPAEGILASRDQAAVKPGDVPAPPAKRLLDIFKHGFELKLQGNYLNLLAYLQALEAQPERLLWQRAQLSVTDYPEAELTLTIYTLSMDKHWLEL